MNQIQLLWRRLLGSLWFVPSLMLCASVGAAVFLIELQPSVDADLAVRWPRVFGVGAEGARGMLSAIATSMITVAGVVFSITVVALSLAASQYSPRVLRHFMSDRATQVVLGAFVSVFAYCLVVLRTIRAANEIAFVPSIAVLGGIVMAFVGVFVLIWFVHHVATAIQVSTILERIFEETCKAVERLFPEKLGHDMAGARDPTADATSAVRDCVVTARRTGYLVSVDGDAMLAKAAELSAVLEIVPRVGDFVIAGLPLLRASRSFAAADRDALFDLLVVERQRTVHQDVPFGIQQIVDIAMKALSPGINDPSTAVACIDRLAALLAALAPRRMPGPMRVHEGQLRLVVRAPDFESMLDLAFAAIGEHAADHAEVYEQLLTALTQVGQATHDVDRRAAVARQVRVTMGCAERVGLPEHRRRRLAASAVECLRALSPALAQE